MLIVMIRFIVSISHSPLGLESAALECRVEVQLMIFGLWLPFVCFGSKLHSTLLSLFNIW